MFNEATEPETPAGWSVISGLVGALLGREEALKHLH